MHGNKAGSKIVGMNMSNNNTNLNMRNLRNQLKMGIHTSESGQNQLIGGGAITNPGLSNPLNPAHHRKSNSNSVNNHAVMSGK